MTLTGAIVGGPGGAASAGIAKRILEDAAVKARISFALSKASRIKGMPIATRAGVLTANRNEE